MCLRDIALKVFFVPDISKHRFCSKVLNQLKQIKIIFLFSRNEIGVIIMFYFIFIFRLADIISMLVNIYGSKELFVNEYRSLLSNRILAHCSYETEREIRYLEMLKLRYSDTRFNLARCRYSGTRFNLTRRRYRYSVTRFSLTRRRYSVARFKIRYLEMRKLRYSAA
jgi:hypothetical protein